MELDETTNETIGDSEHGAPRTSNRGGIQRGREIGRYVILDRMGAGGMGVVYAAYDPKLDRKLAIKVLRRGPVVEGASDQQQERLIREARALARLSHPNVVAVHDVGVFEGRVFLAMEYVDGESLGAWMKHGPHPWETVVRTLADAGKGLAAAHEAGIVHRDVKPDNIMLDRHGRARVLDFGLALGTDEKHHESEMRTTGRSTDSDASGRGAHSSKLTRTGATVGTPAYMSPEQHLGLPVGPESDQFSFCVTLYEALYGERPFEGRTIGALTLSVTEGEVREPTRKSLAPDWVWSVVLHGLRPSPSSRWPDMRALLAALADDPRIRRRRRTKTVLVAAGAFALAGGAYRAGAEPDPAPSICAQANLALGDGWNEEQQAKLQAAFDASPLPYARATSERVVSGIDEYAARWDEARLDACEATNVRGEQSDRLLDASMACLAGRRVALETLIDVYSSPVDETRLERSITAVAALPRIEPCRDLGYLTAQLRDIDPVASDQLANAREVREEVQRARTLELAGEYERGLALLDSITAGADQTGHRPLMAEVAFARGALEVSMGDRPTARDSYFASAELAVSGGDYKTAADAMAALVYLHASDPSLRPAALRWAGLARAHVDRLGDAAPPKIAARILSNEGVVFDYAGEFESARERHERALAMREEIYGPNHPDVASSLNNLGVILRLLGEIEAARAAYERSLQIRREVYGSDHPRTMMSLSNLGNLHIKEQDNEEAARIFERVVTVRERSLGPDHPDVAAALNNLGVIAKRSGDLAKARERYERAAKIQRRHTDSADALAFTLSNLAGIQQLLGDHEQARENHAAAVDTGRRALGDENPRLAGILVNAAGFESEHGSVDTAIEQLEQALAIRVASLPAGHARTAVTRFDLAKQLWHRPAERERARELALTAETVLAAAGKGQAGNLALVSEWRAEHRGG